MLVEDPLILLVDDSFDDGLLMRIAFERSGFLRPLEFAHDGEEAIAYLSGEGAYSNRVRFPLPNVLLLDLNMPRRNGFEVLAWIRQQPALRRLCVYVLSASSRSEDIAHAYDLGANSYFVKPSTLQDLMRMAVALLAALKLTQFPSVMDAGKNKGAAPMNALPSHGNSAGLQTVSNEKIRG